MITFVKTEAVLPLRAKVLRDGKPAGECAFPGDERESTFHLADIKQEQVICVATFHLQSHPDFAGKGYQLRGMATESDYRGHGLGTRLVNFAIVYLRGMKADYIWCNARKNAYSFYMSQGFEFISGEFEVPDIGPHRTMYLRIM